MDTAIGTPPGDARHGDKFEALVELMEGKTRLLSHILDAMGDGVSIQDEDMRIVFQNKFMRDHFGSHVGDRCYKVYENRDSECDGCPIAQAFHTGKITKALRVGVTRSGEKFRFENIASLLRDSDGKAIAGVELVRLVEDRERALDELRVAMQSLSQAAAVFNSSGEGILVVNRDNRIVSVNPAFKAITGYSAEEVVGADPRILASGRHSKEFFAALWRSLDETGTWRGEIWNRRKDGAVYIQSTRIDTTRSDDGQVLHRVCVLSDVTDKKLAEKKIEHMAQHDALTNLPNRMLFVDRLQQALATARREKTRLAVLYVDLDRFKPVNDTLGHLAGDALLQMAARRMRGCLRESDTVARIGGDEFAMVLPNVQSRRAALVVAERVRVTIEEPFQCDGNRLEVSCSVGGVLYPDDAVDVDSLIHGADQAMYLAKRGGRNKVCFPEAAGGGM